MNKWPGALLSGHLRFIGPPKRDLACDRRIGCKIGTDLLARRCSLMTDRADPFETIARPLIQQCRREIGAAWVQIEAAREGLRRSRWLLAVWEEQRRKGDVYWKTRPDLSGRSEAARIGMFVPSHAPYPPRRRLAPPPKHAA
jgi:hypothetical protein